MVWGSCFADGVLEGVMLVRWCNGSSGMVWGSCLSDGVVWGVADQVVWCGGHACQMVCGV